MRWAREPNSKTTNSTRVLILNSQSQASRWKKIWTLELLAPLYPNPFPPWPTAPRPQMTIAVAPLPLFLAIFTSTPVSISTTLAVWSLFICSSTYLPVYLYFELFIHLYIYLSVCLSIFLSFFLSVCLSFLLIFTLKKWINTSYIPIDGSISSYRSFPKAMSHGVERVPIPAR